MLQRSVVSFKKFAGECLLAKNKNGSRWKIKTRTPTKGKTTFITPKINRCNKYQLCMPEARDQAWERKRSACAQRMKMSHLPSHPWKVWLQCCLDIIIGSEMVTRKVSLHHLIRFRIMVSTVIFQQDGWWSCWILGLCTMLLGDQSISARTPKIWFWI